MSPVQENSRNPKSPKLPAIDHSLHLKQMETLIEEGVKNRGKKVVVEPVTEQEIFEELKSVQKPIKLKIPSLENKKAKIPQGEDSNI